MTSYASNAKGDLSAGIWYYTAEPTLTTCLQALRAPVWVSSSSTRTKLEITGKHGYGSWGPYQRCKKLKRRIAKMKFLTYIACTEKCSALLAPLNSALSRLAFRVPFIPSTYRFQRSKASQTKVDQCRQGRPRQTKADHGRPWQTKADKDRTKQTNR